MSLWAGTEVFPHRTHAPLKMACTVCHAGAGSAVRAGFPEAKRCAACHRGRATPALPSRRLYKLKDYVIFSHARHAGKAPCGECHGAVYEMPQLKVFQGVTMKDCVDCHQRQAATLVCNVCHELGM